MQNKTLRGTMQIKAEATGQVEAVFATFNVVDADGDVILPGAITPGRSVLMTASHNWQLDGWIGEGKLRRTPKEAVFDGRFWLDTADGRQAFEKVRRAASAGLGEWSFGFDIPDGAAHRGEFEGQDVRYLGRDAPLDIREVSPVLAGAGVDTRTVAIKSPKKAALSDTDFVVLWRPGYVGAPKADGERTKQHLNIFQSLVVLSEKFGVSPPSEPVFVCPVGGLRTLALDVDQPPVGGWRVVDRDLKVLHYAATHSREPHLHYLSEMRGDGKRWVPVGGNELADSAFHEFYHRLELQKLVARDMNRRNGTCSSDAEKFAEAVAPRSHGSYVRLSANWLEVRRREPDYSEMAAQIRRKQERRRW